MKNSHFVFKTGQATDVGLLRMVNEDSLLERADLGLWAVADGMGGHAAGDFASRAIVEELNCVGPAASGEELKTGVMGRLARANDAILAHAETLQTGTIGATVAVVVIHERRFWAIWSGDSRIYLLRAGKLLQQSKDHTEVQALLDAGTITEAQARVWPRKNVITRAIGVSFEPECDILTETIEDGDTFLICSDGLTEHMEDAEIERVLDRHGPQEACDALITETLRRGARDNVTVVALHCVPLASAKQTRDLDEAIVKEQ